MGRILVVAAYLAFVASVVAGILFYGVTTAPTSNIHNRASNVDVFGGFLSAITAVGADNRSLLITRMHTVPTGTSCTVGPNTELIFTPGSGISIAPGATVEFRGPIVAGSYRVIYGSGDSVFGTAAMEPFFQNAWIAGTSEVGRSRQPAAGYGFDVRGDLRADNLHGSYSGTLPFASITGTATNDQLPDPITKGVQTDDDVTGGVPDLAIAANSDQYLTGTSLMGTTWITGATNLARDPTSGITIIVNESATGKQSFFVYNADDTAQSGNTLFFHFPAGDTVISDIDCIPGVSKWVISGTTLEKTLVVNSTGTSEWTIATTGTPTVEAD